MKETAEGISEVLEVDFSRPVNLRGNRVGTLVGWSKTEGPIVDHSSNPHGPIAARTTVSLDAQTVRDAIENDQEVLLVFEAERSDRPIIVGLLRDCANRKAAPAPVRSRELTAKVDGRHVKIEAKEQITLQCGQGSITLKRDGKIVVRGTQIVTRASGANKIKGASVRIN
jgi:hypothetical protein